MRKIISNFFVSVDGVVQSPENWTPQYGAEDIMEVIASGMEASDALLLGRRTYEIFAAYWPHQSPENDPIAGYINEIPKFVVSTTLTSLEWRHSTLITGDVGGKIATLKEQPGKDISISGSPTLVRWLLREGMLDELDLLVYPIVVGTGGRLFDDWTGKVPLKLTESRGLSTGVVLLRYERAD